MLGAIIERFFTMSQKYFKYYKIYLKYIKNVSLKYFLNIAQMFYNKVNVPVLARVSMLARLNAFLGKIRKIVNVFGKKFSLLSLNIN